MNKYNYQFQQCVNSISLINDSAVHRLRTTLNIIFKVLSALSQLLFRLNIFSNSNFYKVCSQQAC